MRFDGQVILVTGGSRGLGRAFARGFAARGGLAVINSLGSPDEDEPGLSAAEVTRREIEESGGRAVIFDAPVDQADRIIEYCREQLGGLHAIVHSAGFPRDVSFGKMNFDDWRSVMSVHLDAAYRLSHAAWPLFRQQQYGRLLFVSSATAMYGNFGQANYGAAKAGLIGLANTLAVEGAGKNIHCNCLAPVALTRMNEQILDKQLHDRFTTESVAPLAVYLCHDSCEENGGLFEAAGGWFSKVRFQRSSGVVLSPENLGPEDVAARWESVCDFENAESPGNMADAMRLIAERSA